MDKYEYKPNAPKRDLLREENLTYDDYAAFDDGNRYELAAGRLELMSPGPDTTHEWITVELLKRLSRTCEDDAVIFTAPIDVILAPNEVRQPDLVVLLRSNLQRLSKRGIEGPPDVVAEILSPATTKRDRHAKMIAYAKHGIPEYWIIDPPHVSLEQYLLEDDRCNLANVLAERDVVASPRLPCVSFTMQEIVDTLPVALR